MISLDQRLERWIVGHRAEPFDTIFVALSHIGSFGIVWFALAVRAELRARRSVDEGDEALAAGEKPSVRGPE